MKWLILSIQMKFKISKEKAKEFNPSLNKEKDKKRLNNYPFSAKTDYSVIFIMSEH